MNAGEGQIRFGHCDVGLYLAIEGPATRFICPAADRLVGDYLAAHPETAKIALDLGATASVDSTFAGWLLSLRKQVRALPAGALYVSGFGEGCRKSLDTMRLTPLFEQRPVAPPAKTTTIPCTGRVMSSRVLLELMARAHEELAALDEESRRVFGPIAATLYAELEKADGPEPDGA